MNNKESDDRSQLEEICPRLKNESAKAYDAFADFTFIRCSRRELLKVYLERRTKGVPVPTDKEKTISSWCLEFNWIKRRDKWRSHLYKRKEQQLFEEWDKYRDRMLEQVEQLTAKADQMLQMPITEKKVTKTVTTDSGEEIPTLTVIKPSRWNANTISAYYEQSAKLMKMVIGDEGWAIELLLRLGYTVLRNDDEEIESEIGEQNTTNDEQQKDE